jgi:WD40 repeat protein
VWDVSTLPPRKVGTLDYSSVSFSPDSRWLIGTGIRGNCEGAIPGWEVWDTATLQSQYCFPDEIADPLFAPDGKTCIHYREAEPRLSWLRRWFGGELTEARYELLLRDAATGQTIAALAAGNGVDYLRDGQSIATWTHDGRIRIWDIPPRRPWWIEYGLPCVFGVVLLGFIGYACRVYATVGPQKERSS